MALPLLQYAPSTTNSRVAGYEISGDDQPRVFSTDNLLSPSDMDTLIEAAYRQIYFHAFAADREPFLESQLRNGQISVRQFVRGLLLSSTFTKSFYNLNSNYRFVEHCVQRVLGRDVYSEREKIAWSILVATKGRAGFVDALLDSEEYISAFGESIVPYQRRRVLPGRSEGELPFNIKSPRYNDYYRMKLGFPKAVGQTVIRSFKPQGRRGTSAGDPANFMDMARSISPTGSTASVSIQDVDFIRGVPYRKIGG